jgi:2',3'-cyclic-nucleotide 2'-phosphodiesterase / 3'-nucleotidase
LLSAVALFACGGNDDAAPVPGTPPIAAGTSADLTILETTDLHTNIRSYDYFKLAEDKSLGFERTATLR